VQHWVYFDTAFNETINDVGSRSVVTRHIMKKCDYNVNITGRQHVTTIIPDTESKNFAQDMAAYGANNHAPNYEVDN
jgi:hypothetical protein